MYLLYKLCFQKKNMAICFKCNKKSLKAFAQQRKPSSKQKDNLQNGRRYLQKMWPTKD